VQLRINQQRSPWIKVRSSDLYILALNPTDNRLEDNRWRDIPENLINYPNSIDTLLSLNSIGNALTSANRWSDRNLANISHSTVVFLAFVISEAARFETVYSAVDALFSYKVESSSWNDFRRLITSWQAISKEEFNNRLGVPISMQLSLTFAQAENLVNLEGIIETLAGFGYPDPDE
jgi:hypothetical protein